MTMQIELEFPVTEYKGHKHRCTNEDCHVHDFVMALADTDDLAIIRQDVEQLKEIVSNLIDLIEPIQAEVTPFMEKLAESPFIKVLTGGK